MMERFAAALVAVTGCVLIMCIAGDLQIDLSRGNDAALTVIMCMVFRVAHAAIVFAIFGEDRAK